MRDYITSDQRVRDPRIGNLISVIGYLLGVLFLIFVVLIEASDQLEGLIESPYGELSQ